MMCWRRHKTWLARRSCHFQSCQLGWTTAYGTPFGT